MDAIDLSGGYRLGEWLVEPAAASIRGPAGEYRLSPEQLQVLQALAARHGQAVGRRELRESVWPGQSRREPDLRAAIRTLREVLGGSPHDHHYIASVGHEGYALVARFESSTLPARAVAAASPPVVAAGADAVPTATGMQYLISELKRRSVFKVMGAYLVGMWIILQVAEVTFEPLQFPRWWMTALTILAVLGLPIVAVLAWSYEITAGGIVHDDGSPGMRLPRARRAIAPAVVAGVALMAGVTGFAWWRTLGVPTEDAPPATHRLEPSAQSIAVLPLVDMSPNAESAYLGDGLSEELSSDLAKLPGLRVAARSSAFAFKGKDLDVRKIGEQLGVRYVLEGSVRRDGDRVRVSAQLIDAISGFQVWTESYDSAWQDLISIQQEISSSIAEALQMVLTPEVSARLHAAPTTDPRAYDFYLAGLSELRQAGALSRIDKAAELFNRALEIDPGFARAQAGLCEVGLTRYERTNAAEHMHDAEGACRAALEADASASETEYALAKLYLASGRYEQAEAVYRSLLRGAPRDAEAHIGLGKALARQNRAAEAERSFREAIVVEPGYWSAYNSIGAFLFDSGRYREAADAFERVTELAPRNPTGFNNLGAALMASGQLDAAARAFEQSRTIEPSRSSYGNLGTLYFFLGRMVESVDMYTQALALAPEDYQLWSGRGDALWYLPNGREQALHDYRRATALAEKNLAVNATSAEIWAMLGYMYGRLGEADRSARYVARALELAPDSPYVSYFAALTAADLGDREEAGRRIRHAIELGYSRDLARPDPALKGVPLG